jgi:NAD(P)-dependent dehydrogenase (short-subunit alcohol dehydrogenase family)
MASKRTTIDRSVTGIGAAVARAFLDRGYGVVGNARSFSGESFPPSPNLALVEGDIGLATTAERIAQTESKGLARSTKLSALPASSRANHSRITPQFGDWAVFSALS